MIVYVNSLGFIDSGEGLATLGEVSAPHPFSWVRDPIVKARGLSPRFGKYFNKRLKHEE
jgi:hypothetical protein